MKVGDTVTWTVDKETQRFCKIFNISDKNGYECYDVLLPERNVPLESIYVPWNQKEINKGDIVIYKKQHNLFEVYVSKVDWISNSAQIRIIKRGLYLDS